LGFISKILQQLYQLSSLLGCSGIYGSPPEKESDHPKACQERPSKSESATGETSVHSGSEREGRGKSGEQRKKGEKRRKHRRRRRVRKMMRGAAEGGAQGTPTKKKTAKAKRQERERKEREATARIAQAEKAKKKEREKSEEVARRKEEEQSKEKRKPGGGEDGAEIEVPDADETEGGVLTLEEETNVDEGHNSGDSDSDLSEVDPDDVDTEGLVRLHNIFEEGRKEYMAWSTAEGEKSSTRGARRIQSFFDKNKGEETFRDGFLVGAMFFHQSSPPVGDTQNALAKIGLESMITPITRTPTEPKNYEVRVWDKNNIESAYRIISKRGKEVAVIVDKPFRWKDLRWVDKVVVKVTGLPFQWDEAWVRKGLFRNLGFPTAGLFRIVRVMFNGKTSGEVQLIYEYVPERIISWGRLARNDFKCTKTKTCAWRIAYPPREYDVYTMCSFCSWNHTTRVDCQVKKMVDSGGWAAAKLAGHDKEDPDKIPYIMESCESLEFAPMRRAQGDWARRRNET
jgi:hypothetical protein